MICKEEETKHQGQGPFEKKQGEHVFKLLVEDSNTWYNRVKYTGHFSFVMFWVDGGSRSPFPLLLSMLYYCTKKVCIWHLASATATPFSFCVLKVLNYTLYLLHRDREYRSGKNKSFASSSFSRSPKHRTKHRTDRARSAKIGRTLHIVNLSLYSLIFQGFSSFSRSLKHRKDRARSRTHKYRKNSAHCKIFTLLFLLQRCQRNQVCSSRWHWGEVPPCLQLTSRIR